MYTLASMIQYIKKFFGSLPLFFIAYVIYTQPPPAQLYAFADYFDDRHYHLCPLTGVIALESSWLKNLWLLGNKDYHIIQVLHTLFNSIGSNELQSTTYEPYKNFTYKTIAALLQFLDAPSGVEKDTHAHGLIDILRTTFKGNKSPARLDQFIEHIIGAQQEIENGLYCPSSMQQILHAFLAQKACKIRELRLLVQDIRKKYHVGSDNVPTISRTSPWSEDEFQQFFTWCQTSSQADDEHIPYDIERDFEFLIAACCRQRELNAGAPPQLLYNYCDYEDIKHIADCCENSLRFFCYLLLYDPEKQLLDLNRLSPTSAQRIDHVYSDFFQQVRVTTAQEINDQAMRQRWYQLVSNIVGAVYRRQTSKDQQCEIHPSCQNFLYLLHHIFGIPYVSQSITQDNVHQVWNRWCSEISAEGAFDLRCSRILFQRDVKSSLTFTLTPRPAQLQQRPELIFTLHIQPEHSWITLDNQNAYVSQVIEDGQMRKTHGRLLAEKIYQQYTLTQSPKARDLLHLFAPYLPATYFTRLRTYDTLLFAHPTDNDRQLCALFKRLLAQISSPDAQLMPSLLKLIDFFYDPYYIQSALCTLLQKKRLLENTMLRNRLSAYVVELPIWEKYHLFLTLLHKKAWHYPEYRDVLLTCCAELPDSEESEEKAGLVIDTKATALVQALLYGAFLCDVLRDAFYEVVCTMSQERTMVLCNRLRFLLPRIEDDQERNVLTSQLMHLESVKQDNAGH